MKIYMKALGCRLNEAELENWGNEFHIQGHTLTPSPEQADVIILNTCAVTQEAVKKSRQLIRKVQRLNPNAKLVVSGCYASLAPALQNDIAGIDMLVSNQDKDRLPEIVNEQLIPDAMPATATGPGTVALFQRGRNRAFIKIQDGCRYRCAYCIVTLARGTERSRKISEIIDHINLLHEQGIKETVLTGVHVGGYGSDINSDLYTLIRRILDHTDIPRLRLASVEPWDLPENFFELFANQRLMPHMHLPLQSGSDEILKAMSRRCRSSDYIDLIKQARSQVPGFSVTTDIIVGFPGESDREWRRGLEVIETIRFAHMHIFPYSARPGTRAANMPGQVAPEIKRQRCLELNALSATMKLEYLRRQAGKQTPVLIEQIRDPGVSAWTTATGYTPNYCRVHLDVKPGNEIENQILDVTILSLNKARDGLVAVLN